MTGSSTWVHERSWIEKTGYVWTPCQTHSSLYFFSFLLFPFSVLLNALNLSWHGTEKKRVWHHPLFYQWVILFSCTFNYPYLRSQLITNILCLGSSYRIFAVLLNLNNTLNIELLLLKFHGKQSYIKGINCRQQSSKFQKSFLVGEITVIAVAIELSHSSYWM